MTKEIVAFQETAIQTALGEHDESLPSLVQQFRSESTDWSISSLNWRLDVPSTIEHIITNRRIGISSLRPPGTLRVDNPKHTHLGAVNLGT